MLLSHHRSVLVCPPVSPNVPCRPSRELARAMREPACAKQLSRNSSAVTAKEVLVRATPQSN
eukprot:11334951-Alexandrium_andersonii.AAC.1